MLSGEACSFQMCTSYSLSVELQNKFENLLLFQLQYPVYWDHLEFCDGFRKLLDHLQLDKVSTTTVLTCDPNAVFTSHSLLLPFSWFLITARLRWKSHTIPFTLFQECNSMVSTCTEMRSQHQSQFQNIFLLQKETPHSAFPPHPPSLPLTPATHSTFCLCVLFHSGYFV